MVDCSLTALPLFIHSFSNSSIAVDVCEKWVKELIEKDVVKMTINEKGHVVMAKATPSV